MGSRPGEWPPLLKLLGVAYECELSVARWAVDLVSGLLYSCYLRLIRFTYDECTALIANVSLMNLETFNEVLLRDNRPHLLLLPQLLPGLL